MLLYGGIAAGATVLIISAIGAIYYLKKPTNSDPFKTKNSVGSISSILSQD